MPPVILLLIVVPLFLAFVIGLLIGQSGREHLRRELAHVLGQLKQSEDKAAKMTEIAGKALTVAHEKHFPKMDDLRLTGTLYGEARIQPPIYGRNYHADPDPFRVENCPECLVSVRASEWPQECPACHSVFGFTQT